jgi:hypothetical protein
VSKLERDHRRLVAAADDGIRVIEEMFAPGGFRTAEVVA